MNKKLLAVAVAGALALPGVALAQSGVTISGIFKLSVENLKMGNFSAARAAGASSSQTRLADDSSRIVFTVVEDLGGGMSAFGQYDVRIKVDDPGSAPAAVGAANNVGGNIGSGNTHIGIRGTWGRLLFGKQDLHYGLRESDMTAKADLRTDSVSILSYANAGASGIANVSRTQNVVYYTTPSWGGFNVHMAYSTNPSAADADLGAAVRKGRAMWLQPLLVGSNYVLGYSYWTSKADGAGAGSDQRADRLAGSYVWGGFKVGLAWDKSKIKNGTTGVTTSDRTAWSIPASYSWGPHEIHFHYDKARADRAAAFAGLNTSAKMFALAYNYNLSKRTSASVSYAKITNDSSGVYNFFTSTSLGDASGAVLAGEDPRVMAFTLRHAF